MSTVTYGWFNQTTRKFVECNDMECSLCPSVGLVWKDNTSTTAGITPDMSVDGILAQLMDAKPTTAPSHTFGKRASHYRTQKARGVNGIKREAFPTLHPRRGFVGKFPSQLYTLPHDGMDLCTALFAGPFPKKYFARPCPTVPRHGFVESRIVESPKDLKKVVKETLKEDLNGEVLVMPVLSGWFSGVAHNAGISWGHGNDGVTGGTSNVFIPCPVPEDVWSNLRESDIWGAAKYYDTWPIDFDGKVPYIELVENARDVVPVQVRAGPPQDVAPDYIPRPTVVKRVIKPKLYSDNIAALLDWEKLIAIELKDNGGPEGLVVQSTGLSLASHWAIHAIQAGIAVVTTKQVSEGENLEQVGPTVPVLVQSDYEGIAKVIRNVQNFSIGPFKPGDVILTAMAAAHSVQFWGGEHNLQLLRGIAVEMIARFLAAACLGEARHFYTCGPGRPNAGCPEEGDYARRRDYERALKHWESAGGEEESHLPWEKLFGPGKRKGLERTTVYYRMLSPMDPRERADLVRLAAKDFRTMGWGSHDNNDDCSYGGNRWAEVCEGQIALAEATQRFLDNPNRSTWDKLAAKMNMACHIAHNGGNVLTKWIKRESLNVIAFRPTFGFMNYFAGWVTVNGLIYPRVDGGEE